MADRAGRARCSRSSAAGLPRSPAGASVWIGPIVILVIVPAIDLVAGLDRSNPPDDVIEALEDDRYYRWITYLFLPIQYVGAGLGLLVVGRGLLGSASCRARSAWRSRSAASAGIGINTAHELGHKKEKPRALALQDRAGADVLRPLLHRAQPRPPRPRRDPRGPGERPGGRELLRSSGRARSSARCAAPGGWRSAATRRKQSHWSIGNDVLNAWLMSVVLWGAADRGFGVGILPYLVIQAVVGFSLLEVVNYMEHYGMLRQKVGVGERQRYERVDPATAGTPTTSPPTCCSTTCSATATTTPTRPAATRRCATSRSAPVLPTGYAGMIVLALVPPLWRRVMDPRVLRHFDGDITRANIQPARRARILAAHAAPAGGGAPGVGRMSRFRCASCGYVYDEAAGNPREGFPAGTPWSDVPDDWCCPDCGVREKIDFVPVAGGSQGGADG